MSLTQEKYMKGIREHYSFGGEDPSDSASLAEILRIKYTESKHDQAEDKRLGMQEMEQLPTALLDFFEHYDANSEYDNEEDSILVRYIHGHLQPGELDALIEAFKKYYGDRQSL